MADFVPELRFTTIADLIRDAHNTTKILKLDNETKIISNLVHIWPANMVSDVWNLKINAKKLEVSLVELSDLKTVKKVANFVQPLLTPNLQPLAKSVKCIKLGLKAINETRLIHQIYLAEQKRKEIMGDCLLYADWAGNDLKKWKRVFEKFENNPKALKILDEMIDSAHSQFALILSETQNLEKIRKQCENDPFLQHEYGILKEKMEQYYNKQMKLEEMQKTSGLSDDKYEYAQKTHSSNIYFRP